MHQCDAPHTGDRGQGEGARGQGEGARGQGDDADARGAHRYPDEPPPVTRPVAGKPDPALTREAGQYVAGADGTQEITTPDADH